MKKINWKTLIITCIVTLLPIFLGLAVYSKLPDQVPIHWGVDNEPNGWAPKNFAVFGLPILMMLLQVFCCGVTDLKKSKDQPLPKMMKIVIWFIPILTIILYTVTMFMALGTNLDTRLIACFIIGILFIIMGNYFPKISFENRDIVNTPKAIPNEKIWRKFTRVMGISLIGEGLFILISLFFPPVVTIVAICSLFVVCIGVTIYAVILSKEK